MRASGLEAYGEADRQAVVGGVLGGRCRGRVQHRVAEGKREDDLGDEGGGDVGGGRVAYLRHDGAGEEASGRRANDLGSHVLEHIRHREHATDEQSERDSRVVCEHARRVCASVEGRFGRMARSTQDSQLAPLMCPPA